MSVVPILLKWQNQEGCLTLMHKIQITLRAFNQKLIAKKK